MPEENVLLASEWLPLCSTQRGEAVIREPEGWGYNGCSGCMVRHLVVCTTRTLWAFLGSRFFSGDTAIQKTPIIPRFRTTRQGVYRTQKYH